MVSSPLTALTALHGLSAIGPYIPQNAASKMGIAQVTDLPAPGAGGMLRCLGKHAAPYTAPYDVCFFHNRVTAVTHVEPVIHRDICLLHCCQATSFLHPAEHSCYPKAELCAAPPVCPHISLDTADLRCLCKSASPIHNSHAAAVEEEHTRESTSCLCEIPMETT